MSDSLLPSLRQSPEAVPIPQQEAKQVAMSKVALAREALERVKDAIGEGYPGETMLRYANEQVMRAGSWLAQANYLLDMCIRAQVVADDAFLVVHETPSPTQRVVAAAQAAEKEGA